ncbi:MAG: response regulator [Desulfobacterales bacterium]|nr:response regulator [Desulfobacterales bacterium]
MSLQERKIRILAVDDEEIYLHAIVGLLAQTYKIIVALNGQDGLKIAQSDPPPDLILLDVMMPDMGGFEVCRQLKKDPSLKNIPVVFLSALEEVENKTKGFKVGGVDYITKPFQGAEVLARVKTHIENLELHRRLARENTRFKTLAEASFEGIFIHDQGRILDVNSEASRLFSCKPQELLGQNLIDRLPTECKSAMLNEADRPLEGEIANSRGGTIPVEIRTKNFDFETHPVSVTAIRDLSSQKTIENEKRALQNENRVLKNSLEERYRFGDIIGRSPAMKTVYELISQAASSDFHVIITGESGTGKELVARTIYELSRRKKNALVAVNCSAITESLFEREFFGHQKGSFTGADRNQPGFFDEAHKGTLFLDELGELKPSMQVKLLRVLENGEYIPVGETKAKKADARIISATNQDLTALVRQGNFREDLFYRIHVIDIKLPPLRERREDIPLLVEFFLARFPSTGRKSSLTGKMLDTLSHYEWPGNVRELQNTMQRFLATDQITLPGGCSMSAVETEERLSHTDGLNGALEDLECRLIQESLHKTLWNRSQAADRLKISRWTLQRKMQKYDLGKKEDQD